MTTNRQAFIVSVTLHGAAIGLLAVLVFLQPFKPEEKPVVLELVNLPELSEPSPTTSETPTPPTLEELAFEEITERVLPDIAIPEPEPEPAPQVQPEPQPTPQPEPKPAPKPEPKPAPKPDPKPKLMTREDFLKQHDLPKTATPKSKPVAAKPVPRISTNAAASLSKLLTVSPSNANADSASPQLIAYQQRLVQAIELRWDKPLSGSGDEWAEVSFTVMPDGSIRNVRILRRNGPDIFVASVREAVARTPSIGARPAGWNGEMVITFRLH